ncbi:hypothetical protein GCM10010279_70490 [Streptomyces mutabilis]|nr:hypothetical protein GCM10010279_70490 [Streptomyces mutabilis]
MNKEDTKANNSMLLTEFIKFCSQMATMAIKNKCDSVENKYYISECSIRSYDLISWSFAGSAAV